MQTEISDTEIVRLIAYVKPVQLSEDDEEDLDAEDATTADEYLIDFLTVQEAKSIGSTGLLNKIADILTSQKIINVEEQSTKIVWRLVRDGDLTPIEQQTKQSNEEGSLIQYQIKDLRKLH